MIYEHPLAYLLGLEGIALLRSFTGEYDRDFVDTLPVGVALDAACGTGRFAASLTERGHQILGVDSSPDMLARARERVPQGEFLLGDLHHLPVPDDAVDLVVCSLALTHVPALKPVMAEFARVLRPGGHLVISDIHPEGVARGVIPPVRRPDGQPGRLATYRHLTGDYMRAALPVGLQVRRCEGPRVPAVERPQPTDTPRASETIGPWEHWPWCLTALASEAARAANAGVPTMIVWHFQLTEHQP
ncbi:SAM-dependent methyltransferase [Streptosporangium album]|uniref:SAM-dependent methyltransferase n=1 Tax=Streptosporangium album TaxID=47479 RepID=A0A7W7S4P8_9ACTN|nr:class I SAM-dependent methyltransferase [Streptosporangium album]MBB4943462.1 SAM-dependent methyltransferase [Streptosporangium album]